jgi:hypothetical protein
MRSTFVYGVAIVSVVWSCVSCRGGPSSVPPMSSGAQQPVAPAASKTPLATKNDYGHATEKSQDESSTQSDCIADAQQLPLKIFYAPNESALEPADKEYRGDIDDHAEQVWRLEQFKVVDDTFITGTLTEGSAHLRAFDDEKERFYRRSQWLCQ